MLFKIPAIQVSLAFTPIILPSPVQIKVQIATRPQTSALKVTGKEKTETVAQAAEAKVIQVKVVGALAGETETTEGGGRSSHESCKCTGLS